jgi:hypothetical protein
VSFSKQYKACGGRGGEGRREVKEGVKGEGVKDGASPQIVNRIHTLSYLLILLPLSTTNYVKCKYLPFSK